MSSSLINAQAAKIGRDQYFLQFDKATEATGVMFPGKVLVMSEEFKNGQNYKRKTETYEYVTNDRSRHIIETTTKGKTTTDNYIQVGPNYFCKQGRFPWKKSSSKCEPVRMSMGPEPKTEEFTVDNTILNGKKSRVFRMYQTWTWPKTANGVEYYFEQVFAVDSSGVLLKIVIREGETRLEKANSTQTETYEYGITIPTIEAPIK